MGKPIFKQHVDRVRKLAKERGNVSVPALEYELSMSPGYVMRIAQAACEVDSDLLMRRPYSDTARAWIVFTKKGFEDYQAKRQAENAARFEEARKARATLVSKPQGKETAPA